MLQRLTIRLKSAYTKLFPLDSFRRFVADQLFQSLYFFVYYGGIIATTFSLVFGILYVLGKTTEHFFGPAIRENPGSLSSAMAAGFCVVFMIASIVFLCIMIRFMMHECDYVHWVKNQKSQAVAADADVENYAQTSLVDRALPMASLRKYLVLRTVYVLTAIIALAVYVVFSIWIVKVLFGTPTQCQIVIGPGNVRTVLSPCMKEDIPDVGIFFLSFFVQLIVGFAGYITYLVLNDCCQAAYGKHLRRAESSNAKRDDA